MWQKQGSFASAVAVGTCSPVEPLLGFVGIGRTGGQFVDPSTLGWSADPRTVQVEGAAGRDYRGCEAAMGCCAVESAAARRVGTRCRWWRCWERFAVAAKERPAAVGRERPRWHRSASSTYSVEKKTTDHKPNKKELNRRNVNSA